MYISELIAHTRFMHQIIVYKEEVCPLFYFLITSYKLSNFFTDGNSLISVWGKKRAPVYSFM